MSAARKSTRFGESGAEMAGLRDELRTALTSFRGAEAQYQLDDLFARFTLETVLSKTVMPLLAELGERWACGDLSVAQEHYASRLIEGRLLALSRGWERGSGRLAVLACAPGEQHTCGLIAFGLALHNLGWRIAYLGADSPVDVVAEAARAQDADVVVISSVRDEIFVSTATWLGELAAERPLLLGGAGATERARRVTACELLTDDPVGAAARVAKGSYATSAG